MATPSPFTPAELLRLEVAIEAQSPQALASLLVDIALQDRPEDAFRASLRAELVPAFTDLLKAKLEQMVSMGLGLSIGDCEELDRVLSSWISRRYDL